MKHQRTIGCLALAAVCLVAIVIGYCFVASKCTSAEYALHATIMATTVVEQFVQEHGRWPVSWKELESVSGEDRPLYSWPRDSDQIKMSVEIDFDLKLEDVANQEPDRFTAIRPKVPAFQAYGSYFASLLETVRKKRKEQGDKSDIDAPGAVSRAGEQNGT